MPAHGALTRGIDHFGARQIGDVKSIDRLFAECDNMGGGDIEVQPRQSQGQIEQQAGAVEAGNLDDAVHMRQAVVDDDIRRHIEGFGARNRRIGLDGDEFVKPDFAAKGLFDGAGYAFAWFYTAVLFEVLPLPGVIASAVALWLSLLALAAMTFLCSVLARSALVAGGAGFVALIVTSIVSAFPIVGPYMPTALWKPAVDLALGTDPGSVGGPAVASVAFVAGCLGLAAAAFRRQEL